MKQKLVEKDAAVRRIAISKAVQRISSNKTIQKSAFLLLQKRNLIGKFEDFEEFACKTMDYCPPELRGFEYHFVQVRASIARSLWADELYIGTSVLDSLLFGALKDASVADPIGHTIGLIRDFGLHMPGFVVYPMNSLGIIGSALLKLFRKRLPESFGPLFIEREAGIVLTPQLNSEKAVIPFLQHAAILLGINKRLPLDLVNHYMRSRPLQWIHRNPLMLVRTQSFSGAYYENQALLTVRLHFSTALIFMLSVLSKRTHKIKVPAWLSSSRINNFETLDIKHYLVFQRPVRKWLKHLDIDCIPMNQSQMELAEISDLNVEIDPREWYRRPRFTERVRGAIRRVESGYAKYCISASSETASARVYRKLFDSLRYFKRSFRSRTHLSDTIVSLAISFEVLLTDFYSPGVSDRVLRRVKLALRGIQGTRRLQKAVEELLSYRGEILHRGISPGNVELHLSQKAFVLSFLAITEKLPHEQILQSDCPMGDLLGDR